jgi:hypothetical protein
MKKSKYFDEIAKTVTFKTKVIVWWMFLIDDIKYYIKKLL